MFWARCQRRCNGGRALRCFCAFVPILLPQSGAGCGELTAGLSVAFAYAVGLRALRLRAVFERASRLARLFASDRHGWTVAPSTPQSKKVSAGSHGNRRQARWAAHLGKLTACPPFPDNRAGVCSVVRADLEGAAEAAAGTTAAVRESWRKRSSGAAQRRACGRPTRSGSKKRSRTAAIPFGKRAAQARRRQQQPRSLIFRRRFPDGLHALAGCIRRARTTSMARSSLPHMAATKIQRLS